MIPTFEVGEVCIWVCAFHSDLQACIGQEVTVEEVGPLKAMTCNGEEMEADYIVSGLPQIDMFEGFENEAPGWVACQWWQLRKKDIQGEPDSLRRVEEIPVTA
jgi:hypothetical protein